MSDEIQALRERLQEALAEVAEVKKQLEASRQEALAVHGDMALVQDELEAVREELKVAKAKNGG